ncbi:hypothetical protein BCR34DRAFT_555956 [Clohesyomyces aquaticus]|uniref:Uncharacterized protein n=1 Tax=Clohesyomyces aquaticus TaxID=1231657 RepID=A0A1Y2A3I2_9PLEO|nr:hypothetical protein BCR34DRAFT_555956 [Clohesyomyces aquaticus]
MGQALSTHQKCGTRTRTGRKCGNPVDKHSDYCESHECPIGKCKEKSEDGRSFCLHHTCLKCRNLTDPGLYCYTHKCKSDGCSSPRRSGGNGQRFCERRHACTITVCPRKRVVQWSTYCRMHKCSVQSCGAEARAEGGICAANPHAPHDLGLVELPTGT